MVARAYSTGLSSRLALRVRNVVDPDPSSPAGAIADRHVQAGYVDDAALMEVARVCAAVTTEFENVPAASLERTDEVCRHIETILAGTPGGESVAHGCTNFNRPNASTLAARLRSRH